MAIGSLALLAALLLVLPAAASACIEDGGGEDRAPTIGGEQVNPTTLTYVGGTVVLSGEVEDDCGIRSVHGEVLNEGFASFFEMQPVGPGSFVNATVYQGEAQLPPETTRNRRSTTSRSWKPKTPTARSNTPSREK